MPPADRDRWLLPALLGLVAVVYAPVLGLGWVWDDRGLVLHNTVLDAPTWTGVFQRDLWCCTDGDPTPYFRPMMTLTLLLDRAVAGTSPAFAHAQSLGWHLLAVALLQRWLAGRFGAVRATVGAAVFALHPLATEAVAWVASRNDLLAAVGVLGVLWALDRRRPGWAAAAAAFGFLSKESTVLLVPVVALWAWAEGRIRARDTLGVGLAGAAVWALRSTATLGGGALDALSGSADSGWSWDACARMVTLSLGWLTVPWPLTATAGLSRPWPEAPGGWAFLVGGCVGSVGVLGWIVRRGGRVGLASVGSALLLAAPALGALRLYGTLGERYFYLSLAMLGAGVAAAWPSEAGRAGADRAGSARRVTGLVVAGLAILTVEARLPDWRSDATLFAAAWERAPDAYSAFQHGMSVRGAGDDAGALVLLESSLAAEPRSTIACRYVADTARRVLDDAAFEARFRSWTAAGCRALPGFDGPVATQLAAWRRWGALDAWLASNAVEDPSGRLAAARVAAAWAAGDWAAAYLAEGGADVPAVDVRERAAMLLQNTAR